MDHMPLPPNAVAYLDQLEADTLALIRIGRDGTSEVKRFNMTYTDLANALRVIADELDTYANRDK